MSPGAACRSCGLAHAAGVSAQCPQLHAPQASLVAANQSAQLEGEAVRSCFDFGHLSVEARATPTASGATRHHDMHWRAPVCVGPGARQASKVLSVLMAVTLSLLSLTWLGGTDRRGRPPVPPLPEPLMSLMYETTVSSDCKTYIHISCLSVLAYRPHMSAPRSHHFDPLYSLMVVILAALAVLSERSDASRMAHDSA